MKKWLITIYAEDEKAALRHIAIVNEAFQIASEHNLPLKELYAGDKDNECLTISEL